MSNTDAREQAAGPAGSAQRAQVTGSRAEPPGPEQTAICSAAVAADPARRGRRGDGGAAVTGYRRRGRSWVVALVVVVVAAAGVAAAEAAGTLAAMNPQSPCPAANRHKMNNCPGRGRGPRPPWPRRARAAAVITVMAAAALLAAACGGSPSSAGSGGSPTAGGSANSSSAVAYSRCVRSHGVPGFPDPDSSGQISVEAAKRALRAVSDSRAKAATYACRNLNPAGQGNPTLTAQEQQDYLRAAACMRSHGFTNFPDPTFPGGHANLPHIPSSIDTSSPRFTQAAQTCTKLIPAGLPGSRPGG